VQVAAVTVQDDDVRVALEDGVVGQERLVLFVRAVVDLYNNIIFMQQRSVLVMSSEKLLKDVAPAAPFPAERSAAGSRFGS
jgi:hypothetical protein